jgi:hypothetical protein
MAGFMRTAGWVTTMELIKQEIFRVKQVFGVSDDGVGHTLGRDGGRWTGAWGTSVRVRGSS